MVVRDAVEADLPAVKAVYDAEVRGGTATFDTTPPPLSAWRERLASPHHLLVATDGADGAGGSGGSGGSDGSVLGYASSTGYRPRAAYDATREVSVYLAADARGRGVGRALYDVLLGRLRDDGVHTVLAVVALPNPASDALHRAVGFEEVGVLPEVGHKHGRWIDTAFYALRLT
ncbi:GNAT family N-acetyltransferase [Nocardioides litoris]|uniref:GNAT family N-acetyltransferase n=1 Tax=Nocardioides litoris TaxID=1926648 RepID=UPI001121FF4F|nr:GNAT family N-acetyltransferase [Nocardioides litoris]